MPDSGSLMTALGFSEESGRMYERVLPFSGQHLSEVAEHLETTPHRLRHALSELSDSGVVAEDGPTLYVLSPADAVTRLVSDVASSAQTAHGRLMEISSALPYLAGATAKVPDQLAMRELPLDGELIAQTNVMDVLRTMVRGADGDLMWLRPDLMAGSYEDQMIDLVHYTIGKGRRCRGIYSTRALRDAPLAMAERARAGEEIRMLPDVPTRMLVLGTTHALLPEPLGAVDAPRIVVRQRGLVQAATLIFELLWTQAATVAEFNERPGDGVQRRFLLEQMAAGAQDEQIARRLGVSLRTVRRRVAEAMADLDADSRFQAGVEAVRRGWI